MQPSRLAVLIAIGGLLLPTLVTPTPAHASRARVRILRDISGPSPLPADECGLPPTDGRWDGTPNKCGSLTGRGSEYEPHMAVNPANRRNLIAVYSQDNQIDTVVSASRDGGRHWTQARLPRFTTCTGGTAVGTGDPRVSIGPDGIAYTSSLVLEPSGFGVLVNTSTDGGLSWSAPVAVDQNQPSDDAPGVVADPHRPRTAYITWTRGGGILMTFSRTTDGGATWTPPAMIPVEPDPVAMTGPGGGRISVLPDGTLVFGFIKVHAGPAGPTGVWVVRSQNQGDSWSSQIFVTEIPANVLTDPDSGQGIGRGNSYTIASVAVGADGALYVVWHWIESTSLSHIQFVRSVDGGLTWSTPASVADEQTQAFLPTVAVSPAGTVGVTYFDLRNDVLGDQELTTDLWFRHSHDGGATWSETHLAGPFDLCPAPSPDGLYPLGDYFGLVPISRTGFGAAWVQTIGPGPEDATDTFFARLRVSPRR